MPKVGTKRSDRRWRDDDGKIWASEFEYRVFAGLLESLGKERVSRCEGGEGCSFDYTTKVKQGTCLQCGGREVAQERVYTPDVRVRPARDARSTGDYFIETKGYLSGPKRQLLRSFVQARPDVSLVFIFQTNRRWKGLKRTPTEWAGSFLKCPAFVWNGKGDVPIEILDFLGG